ncbi:M20 metallopeptidase family protein [Kribbella sp. CA-245084]|uniref:M20 metallopeptidase family protein n=1 Tax=Kribbella sp. CA-245084 TaxID=3239940 RepID=UPI003D931AFA
MDLEQALAAQLGAAVELRHRLHADPRPSGKEHDTAELLMAELGVVDAPDIAGGRIVRVGDPDGPAIAVRAELDALPVAESNDVPWASRNGSAHLCGHDVHMAALVAVVRALRVVGPPVPLVAVFQPREETVPCGAKDLAGSAELSTHDIRAFLGVHLQPRLAEGRFSAAPGPVNASADEFFVTVTGTPGHAAYPHLTRDPVLAAAATVMALQTVVSRRLDPTHPAVLSVTTISGGDSPNVVTGEVTFSGTIRAFHQSDRDEMVRLLTEVSSSTAAAYGCSARVRVGFGEPVLTNDADLAAAATKELVAAGFESAPPYLSCGADDFSFYGTRYPSLMVFLGVGSGGPGLHHPGFLPADEMVAKVAKAMLAGYLAATRMPAV